MCRLSLGLALLMAGFAALAQNPPSAAPILAGKVDLVEGDVTVYDKAKKPRRVVVGDGVFEGEGIATGQDGELHINMEDGGFIAVRPNTKMSIAAYRAEGGDQDKSVFSLLQGTFRSVTGWIGKFNPRSYQVRTPTATIGVRGTDHEALVIPQGSQEGEPGSYDKVNVGATTIQTKHGSVDVKPNQAGFAPWQGRPVPRLLPQVPAFFKATRHEAIIASRHEAIHRVIEQRRNERRKVFHEKKLQLDRQKAERQKASQERRKELDTQRMRQREERRNHWQDNMGKREPEHSLQPRRERDGLQPGAEGRRKHPENRPAMRPQARDGQGRERDKPQPNADKGHGPHGGGRGRN